MGGEGFSMMIGGDEAAAERLVPIFETLAPAKDQGWGRVGPIGSGPFTKMIHNGIEYGLMQAFDLDVPAPVITLSLLERLRSRDADSYSDKLLAAMRNQFGRHAIKKK